MTHYPGTRIVARMGRRPWYRQVNWHLIGALLFAIGVWAFIFWCAAKAVRP